MANNTIMYISNKNETTHTFIQCSKIVKGNCDTVQYSTNMTFPMMGSDLDCTIIILRYGNKRREVL